MKITVRYFALLRERMGRESEVVSWEDAAPRSGGCGSTWPSARPRSRGVLRGGPLLVAVNREYAAARRRAQDGDEVALFPPVTGG